MFEHYFNMAILYMCLYGEEDLITRNNSISRLNFTDTTFDRDDVLRIANFIKLHKDLPEKDSRVTHYTKTKKGANKPNSAFNPRSFAAYFYGVTYKTWFEKNKNYGSTPSSPDDVNLPKNCITFLDLFPPTNQSYKKLLICALVKDSVDGILINSIIDKINLDDRTWFFDVYRIAISKKPGYFESDTNSSVPTVLERFAEVEESCEKIYLEQLEKYNSEKRNKEKATETSVDDYTSAIHKLAVAWFKTQGSIGRYRGYEKSKGKRRIKEIKNKLDTADGKPRYLIDIIFDESDNTHSINLCGKGGSGKTFQILRAIETILSKKPTVLPFYIPLSSLEFSDINKNCIIEYLDKEIGFAGVDSVKNALSQNVSNVILFADGLNEISDPTIRRKIAIDICQLRQRYKTRFLVSSRQDHTFLFNTLNYGQDKVFTKAEVLDLSEEQINKYFLDVNCSVMYENVPVPTRKLLNTPQGCVMYAELIGSNLENPIHFESLGKLLECYCNSHLEIDAHNAYLECEKALLEIGYKMVLKGWFTISETDIDTILKEAVENQTILEENIPTIKKSLLGENSPVRSIFNENKKHIYEFTHQNFRDLYCAKKFASKIETISPKTLSNELESIFIANNITMNDEILELTSAFIGSGRTSIQSLIDIIRDNADDLTGKYADNYDFPLSVLIRIYAFAHNNNISELNLSELDLTEVCLNGYALFDKASEKGIDLYDAKISFNTFLKVGLPTGSSSICTYVINDKTYIAAFDRTTAMIIDVEENQRQLVRNLSDNGWVNVAYPTTINGEICILLGYDKGKVDVFHPSRLENEPKVFLFDTSVKDNDGIQSIIQINKDNRDYILCSTAGLVFVFDLTSNVLLDPVSVCDETERNKVIEDWNRYDSKMTAACRMDYDKSNDQVLICFGNKVYRIDLKADSFKVSEYDIEWYYQTPRRIRDIIVTKSYIFINEVDAVSVIHNCEKSWEFVIDLDKRLADREQFLRKAFESDGERIKEICDYEKSISTASGIKTKNFYFQKFSPIPDGLYRKEEGVLVGIKTPDESLYNQLPQFIEIKVRPSCKSIVQHNNITPIHTNQTLATHTGVYYSLKSMPSTVFLATTSDDRSVDLIAPHDEEFVPQHIEGAYNGVRDIEFIDDTHFVCAQYDGSLILFSLIKPGINRESSWRVTNVIKSHYGWVWKAEIYEEWSDERQKIISCSYDGTVRITDFCNSETSVPIIKTNQRIRGVYRQEDDIWAFSPNAIYHAKYLDGKWVSSENDTYDKIRLGIADLNICLLENLGNNVPSVFYNSGKDTQGYIAEFTERGKLINKITCEEGVLIRRFKPYQCNGNDYLVVVGTIKVPKKCDDKKEEYALKAYVAIYHKQDNDYSEPISTCFISSPTSESTPTPNDFAIVDTEFGTYIIIVNSNNLISYCRLNEDMKLTVCENKHELDGQPLCIAIRGDLILIGLLNGKITRITITEDNFDYDDDFAFTHANLYSTPNVDISVCDKPDEDAFVAQLKDYFSI